MKEKLNEGGIIPSRRNSMDKGPVMGLKESHPVWSLENEGSRLDHVAEVEKEPDCIWLCCPWEDFGFYIRA